MAVYKVTNTDSPLASVEFTPVAAGNFSFAQAKSPEQADAVRQWLTSQEVGQRVIAETTVDNKPVIITQGDKTKDEMMKLLEEHGDKLALAKQKRSFSDIAWPVRGALGFAGQGLQLSSSFLTKKGFAFDTGIFAALNLVANGMAIAFGAQKRPDDHKLRAIKTDINNTLGDYVAAGETLPSVNEDRSSLRDEPAEPKSAVQKSKEWVRDNSVILGEVGLRTAAGIAVAFPINKWLIKQDAVTKKILFNKEFWKLLETDGLKKAYFASRNDALITHYAGLGSLSGKMMALFAKPEDPYDPKPKSALDNFREKYLFKLGGNVEAVSFAAQTYDNFTNTSPSKVISFRGKDSPNYIAGAGSTLFTSGYVVRNWAKYGVKEMDMDEAYAHAADALAKTPKEQLPQLIAETAASIKSHFKDSPLGYGEIYTHMMDDLYRDHHIAVEKPCDVPEISAEQTKFTDAHPSRTHSHRSLVPSASHTDQVLKAEAKAQTSSYSLMA